MTAKVREAWELYGMGWTLAKIAGHLQLHISTVRWRVDTAMEEAGEKKRGFSFSRCPCGLLLPCDHSALADIGGRRNPWP